MDTSVRWGPPAPGTKDGDEEAAPVHRRVQERGGQAAGGERQDPAGGRPGARGPRQPAQGLAQRAPRGQLGRGPGPAEGRGGRAGPAAAGGEAARAGERDPQAGGGFFRPGGGRLMRYRFVAAERATFPVRALCRIVGASVSGFYAWLPRGPGRRREDDRRVGERIAAIFEASRRTYGGPRVHAELRAEGVRVGRRRVARLMREGGLTVARRRRRVPRTTDSRHGLPVAPNLLDRKFAADQPDTVWLADISHIPTGEGWLYRAAIEDMATREIVGWSMADHLREELARDALLMAIRRRQPPPGLIHHSDRGVQYASGPYRKVLGRHGIRQSMSRKGDCYDNAPMESFFGTLKTELVHRTSFPTREAARRATFEYVEAFYNRRRRHSGPGFLTPAQAYEQMAGAA